MSQKICFIAMTFGFVGSLALGNGMFANVNHTSEHYRQFVLTCNESYDVQIKIVLAEMFTLADIRHKSEARFSEENMGTVLTQNIVITDHDVDYDINQRDTY